MTAEFDEIVRRQALAGALIYNPMTYRWVSKQTTGSNSNTVAISGSQLSVEKLFQVRRLASDMSSTLVQQSGENGQYTLSRFVHPSTASPEEFQFTHGAERYPSMPVDESEVSWHYLDHALELKGDVTCESHCTRTRYTSQASIAAPETNTYITGYDFQRAGRNSGLDISVNEIQFHETVTANPIPTGSQIDCLVMYGAAVQVKSPTDISIAT
jgi:hypothetical protein